MYDPAIEELESEWNAGFDYVREAYAGSAPDALYESWCYHCDECEASGTSPGTFEEFEAEAKGRKPFQPRQWPEPSLDDIPF